MAITKTKSLDTGTDTLCYAGQWILQTEGNSLDNIPEEFATPIHKIRTKTILSSARVAERAQRNWDFNKPVLEEDIQTIIEACTTMPTKQQINYYKLVASTDLVFNRACYDVAIDEDNDHFDSKNHRNGQVYAPLLLIFIENDIESIRKHESEADLATDLQFELPVQVPMSVGISAGVAAFSASMLGYKTGFCACMVYDKLVDLLQTKGISAQRHGSNTKAIFLGIGHGTDFDRKSIVVGNKIVFTAETRDKKIETIRI